MGHQQTFFQKVKSLIQPKSDQIINCDMSHFDKIHYPVPTEVVTNGIINRTNLAKLKLDENWLFHQLNQNGVSSVSEVTYAEVQQDGSLYIYQPKNSAH
ncbi:DUF421 domain-containing protein [Mesobacillus maritimus]|uniref:YetF domain-containing protein n=1 Tax=Mesobacillus maritimus TaxID=1643336 RepID=UPI00203ACC89|nr:YetF domain-containing protein [Mesobacillus maritimus]MCM3669178.1 DUF421 domain-containing protein [Mesobacillus maritimus]